MYTLIAKALQKIERAEEMAEELREARANVHQRQVGVRRTARAAQVRTKNDPGLPFTKVVDGGQGRLDLRRQDLYRARDRAQDAATMYKALDDSRKQAEVETHLGLIELADGQLEKALEHVDTALELGSVKTPEGVRVLPQVAAQAEMVRGMAAKQGQKFKEAAGHFQKANEISGSTGQAGVALESGLAYGEALILSGKAAQAIDVLRRVGMIAQSLKNPMRQRAASALERLSGESLDFDPDADPPDRQRRREAIGRWWVERPDREW